MRLKATVFVSYFFVLFIAWYIIFILKIVSPSILPSPIAVIKKLPEILSYKDKGLLPDVWATLVRSALAFLFSMPIGILVGYIVFYSKWFRQPNELLLDFIRSIPATALIPFFFLFFGIEDSARVAVGTFSSALVICLATIAGLKNRNDTRLFLSRLIGLSGFKRFFFIDIPESLGQIFVGLRAGVSLALILVVVSEMVVGANQGLGRAINDLSYSDDIPLLYCALFATGIMGYFYNYLLSILEKKIIHWKGYN